MTTPHVVSTGSFRIFEVELECYVLSDGQRIIEKDSMEKLFAAMETTTPLDEEELRRFAEWMQGNE